MKQIILYIFLFLSSSYISFSQCYPDRHSTNAHDGWVSCSTAPSPNSNWGNSHWILYDLGQVRQLYQSTIWNLNNPDRLDWNIQSARFDYSLDGVSYSNLTTTSLTQAPGLPLYEGMAGPNFGGVSARYVLITAISNYGGSCFGLGEVRFYTEPGSANSLSLNVDPCINDGVLYGLNGGMNRGGTYVGSGVVSNYDDQFDFDPDAAGPGSHVISYQYMVGNSIVTRNATINVRDCGSAGCMPCPPCSSGTNYTADPLASGVYYENPELLTSGKVNIAYDVNYRGSESVVMDPNFEVVANSVFHAEIRDCSDDVNFLVNGDLESSTVAPWVMELHDVAAASLSLDNVNPYEGTNSARVDVTNVTGTSWHIQFEQFGMSVNAGQTYTLEFAARSSQNRTATMIVSRHNSPWNNYQWQQITLTPQWQTYSIQVTPDETNIGMVRVAALLGDIDPATYWFDNLILKP